MKKTLSGHKFCVNPVMINVKDSVIESFNSKKVIKNSLLSLRSKNAGRFEKLLGFARSHFIVTRGSVSLSCATTPHPPCFSKT